jgi:hypothetical protein
MFSHKFVDLFKYGGSRKNIEQLCRLSHLVSFYVHNQSHRRLPGGPKPIESAFLYSISQHTIAVVTPDHWSSDENEKCALRLLTRQDSWDWTGLDWTGLEWTRLDWTGLDWTRLDSTRLDLTQLDSTRLDSTRLDSVFVYAPLRYATLNKSQISQNFAICQTLPYWKLAICYRETAKVLCEFFANYERLSKTSTCLNSKITPGIVLSSLNRPLHFLIKTGRLYLI